MDYAIFHKVSYGLYVIGSMEGDVPKGCIANALFQVTSENPIMAISLNKENYTYDVIKKTGKFSVSVLSEKTERKVITNLGFKSGRSQDKFAGIDYEVRDGMLLVKENCCAYLLCDVVGMQECNTHMLILGQVTDAFAGADFPPMTYRYYHEVIKGGAPKNAPTYLPFLSKK